MCIDDSIRGHERGERCVLLVIDNYDSFTWNLVQLIGELGVEPVVRRNDEIGVDDVARLAPERIVISPGPCTPAEAGISVDVVRRYGGSIPILGVCLGHQAIGAAYGGRIVRARRIMHGKVAPITHDGAGLFRGLPAPLRVTRYHSLAIDRDTLPDTLAIQAWTAEPGWEDEIQAVRHREFAVWGVQFHPESIASQGGRALIQNFLSST
jgi:anthranilate synthase/aminodeoxychorismate synthase-like glutamine amidotransferase